LIVPVNKFVSSLVSLPPPLLDAAMNSESRNESKSDSSVPPVLSFRPNHRWQPSTWRRCSKPNGAAWHAPPLSLPQTQTPRNSRVLLKDALPGQDQQRYTNTWNHISGVLSLTTPADPATSGSRITSDPFARIAVACFRRYELNHIT